MAPHPSPPHDLSPSERLEQLAQQLTSLADDVLLTVRELREQDQQHVDESRP